MPPQRVGTCETAGATVTRYEARTALPVTGMKKVRASPRSPRSGDDVTATESLPRDQRGPMSYGSEFIGDEQEIMAPS